MSQPIPALCEKCKQNMAAVHVESTINGEKTSYNLCEECASGIEIQMDFSSFFNSFLGTLLSVPEKSVVKERYCETCGLGYSQFQKLGRFGCRDCYASFEPQTQSVIKSIQGGSIHTGKVPGRLKAELEPLRELESLRFKLQKAVEKEEFEEAAMIRDRIKQLAPKTKEGQA